MNLARRPAFLPGIRAIAMSALISATLWVPIVVAPPVVAAATCTGWTNTATPPPTIRVLRTATGKVQTVDFKTYVKVVMRPEWPSDWPVEAMRAGAVSTKQYAWYYTMHYRGGTGTGGCYDVKDNTTDQIYAPEKYGPSAAHTQAVNDTWSEVVIKGGSFITAGFRTGSMSVACGADRDGAHLFQGGTRRCALNGKSTEQILHIYFDPAVVQGGPTPPDPPTAVTALGRDSSAQVSWTAPTNTGGRPVTGYTATSDPGARTCSTTGGLTCGVAGLTNGTPYTFTVKATSLAGTGIASGISNSVTPAVVAGATYVGIKPMRILDSRKAVGLSGKFVANTPRTFTVAGLDPIPTDATAVTGNLAVTGSTNGWAVYLGPNADPHPSTSTINFSKGEVTSNNVTVALSDTGSLSATFMSSSGQTTDLVFDVTGYFTLDGSGDTFHALTPARIVDNRIRLGTSTKLVSNAPRTFAVRGHGNVPIEATAVTGNVTVTNPTGGWALYLGPDPLVKPPSSTLNFYKRQTQANGLTVKLSSTGTLSATYISGPGQTTDIVFDVTGYYAPGPTGSTFVAITPGRLLDTRYANGLSGKITAGKPGTWKVSGRECVPPTATAITGNVTVVNESGGWAIFVGPNSVAKPPTSTLNFVKGDIKANGLTVALSPTGGLYATYMSGSGNTTDLVFDVTGYFQPSSS